jgi:hypothetical protein
LRAWGSPHREDVAAGPAPVEPLPRVYRLGQEVTALGTEHRGGGPVPLTVSYYGLIPGVVEGLAEDQVLVQLRPVAAFPADQLLTPWGEG